MEDDLIVSRTVRRILESEGFTVATQTRPADAIQAVVRSLFATRFCAALLDLDLGKSRGETLALQIRELDPGLPLIAMTGSSRSTWHLEASDFAADIKKPFTREHLLTLVSSFMRIDH